MLILNVIQLLILLLQFFVYNWNFCDTGFPLKHKHTNPHALQLDLLYLKHISLLIFPLWSSDRISFAH